jgi:hypothetical protein
VNKGSLKTASAIKELNAKVKREVDKVSHRAKAPV